MGTLEFLSFDQVDIFFFFYFSGCKVHAYDPSSRVKRPENSYHENIHFHSLGLGHSNQIVTLRGPEGPEQIKIRKLDYLVKENGDSDKTISYLKVDIEGSEIQSFKQWLDSGILSRVDQIGVEMHTGKAQKLSLNLKKKTMYKSLIQFLQNAYKNHGFTVAAYNSNGCSAKQNDDQRLFYSFHDILLIKN